MKFLRRPLGLQDHHILPRIRAKFLPYCRWRAQASRRACGRDPAQHGVVGTDAHEGERGSGPCRFTDDAGSFSVLCRPQDDPGMWKRGWAPGWPLDPAVVTAMTSGTECPASSPMPWPSEELADGVVRVLWRRCCGSVWTARTGRCGCRGIRRIVVAGAEHQAGRRVCPSCAAPRRSLSGLLAIRSSFRGASILGTPGSEVLLL